MYIFGFGQLLYVRFVIMEVMQGFCKKDNVFFSKNSENIVNLGREVVGRMDWF